MAFQSFAAQPPEIISGLIYSGPGAAPLLSAASAWSGLATELHATASSYAAVLAGLSGGWQGAAAAAMAAAAAPYVTWLTTTATQAEETAGQATAAAAAYESAFAGVVPPPVIVANRSELASLVAANILGQNSAAIATTEAQYAQMWAQDVAAMVGYATASQAATQLTAFTAPPRTTNDNTGQAAATAEAARASAQSTAQSTLAKLGQAIATAPSQDGAQNAVGAVTGDTDMAGLYESFWNFQSSIGSEATWTNAVGGTTNLGMTQVRLFHKLPSPPAIPKSALGGGLMSSGLAAGPAPGLAGGLATAASASAGSASTVGALSVPPGWATAAPAIKLASVALPNTAMGAAPAAQLGGLLSPAALGSLTGGALGGPAARVATPGVRVVAANTKNRDAPVKLDQVIAQLQQTPDVVQHWNVDEAGLDDLVAKLSLKPGIHAVHVCAEDEVVPTGSQSALG
ncbi:PPE family protein [Mycobacterium sp. pW045]|uniref:PPE family protein n=1 Tax=Mycobacterium sp. pW045 TaxID=3238984 RepID=UPI00351BEAF1